MGRGPQEGLAAPSPALTTQSRLAAAQITHISDLSKRRTPGGHPLADHCSLGLPRRLPGAGGMGTRSCPGSLQRHSPTSPDMGQQQVRVMAGCLLGAGGCPRMEDLGLESPRQKGAGGL